MLVTLPRLKHPCFTGAEPGDERQPADPVEHVQMNADVDLDDAGGVLCVTVSDRNVNMASLIVNFRADLRSRAVVQRTVFVGEDCKQGAGRAQADACSPAGKSQPSVELPKLGVYGLMSPSGRWAYYSDEKFEQSGDYIYRPAFVHDTQTGKVYAVTPGGLVEFDRHAAGAETALPQDVCAQPGEASSAWAPGRDVLLLEGCGPAGWLAVEPPGRVQAIDARQVVVY